MASALSITAVPVSAMAQEKPAEEQTVEENGNETTTTTTNANDNTAAQEEDVPLYEMNFEQLLEKKNGNHAEAWEIYEFYQLRRIELDTGVTQESVDALITEIEILESIDSTRPITLVINSGGGSVYDGLRLINAMATSPCQIHTQVDGMAASMAAVILIAGDERSATPESRVMIHQVAAGASGQVDRMEHTLNHVNGLQDDLFDIISRNTGLSMTDVRRLASQDVFYDGEESIRLGFIDRLAEGKEGRDLRPGSRDVPEAYYPENRVRDYYRNQRR